MSVGAQTAEQIQQQFLAFLQSIAGTSITDYNIGSVIRLLGSGQANTLESFYEQNLLSVQEITPSIFYQMMQFPPLPAINSYVQETFTNTNATAIQFSAGTLLTIPNSTTQYSVQTTFTVPAASGGTNGTATATIVCTTAGRIGNAPANSITQLVNPVSGVTITNIQAVITGQDAETSDQRAARFQNHLAKIHRGDNLALEAGANSATLYDSSGYIVEQVVKSQAIDGTFVTNPISAPVLTAISGSTSFAAGTYLVGYTYANSAGQTLISQTASVTLTAGEQIQVSAITLPAGATSVNYYLSIGAGSSTLAYDANGTGTQIDLTALPLSGAASPPIINTAYVATPGTATVWGYNGIGTMSSTLLVLMQNVINGYTDAQGIKQTGYKAAGVIVTGYDATKSSLTLAIGILPLPGYTLAMLTGSATIAIQGIFANLDIGDPLYVSDIVFALRQIPGVGNAVVTSPSADQTAIDGLLYILSGTPAYTQL